MLAARNQENLVLGHQNGASKRQLHPKTPGARYPKTPLKVPLNDENAAHVVGGAKGNLTGRARGNENALTSKASKGLDKANFVTPMGPRSRAVLGDKTTNAKANALQPTNGKSAVKSQKKAPTTVQPKAKQPHAETHKLQVHAEEAAILDDDDDVEYCPPKPKDLPYESDVFPDGVLTFEGLKRENLLKGYYDYYVNPVDGNGVSLADRTLAEKTRKAIEKCDRQVQEDVENFEWSIEDELEEAGIPIKKKTNPPVPNPADPDKLKQAPSRKMPSIFMSKKAADMLAMDDATRSLQRGVAKPTASSLPKKKDSSVAIPGLRPARQTTTRLPVASRRGPGENKPLEITSRTTIGYNKGRATATALAQGNAKSNMARPHTARPKSVASLPDTTVSDDAVETTSPALFAQDPISAADEDQQWKERVPFLSIFNPDLAEDEDEDVCDLLAGGLPDNLCEEEDEDFELKLAD